MSKKNSIRTQRGAGVQRRGGRRPGRSRRGPSAYWLMAGVAAVALFLFVAPKAASHHPDPRPTMTEADVKSASAYTRYPRVAGVYRQAGAIPQVLDGLYCYCHCSEHSGHYSLLDCFRSDHGAGCDICLSEAAAAFRMSQDGRTLDEIRDEVDRFFKR